MKFDIWIDADSIPKQLRAIILRAAVRFDTAAYFVADRELSDVLLFIANNTHELRVKNNDRTIKSKIKMITVSSGENSADDYIVQNATPTSLCISHDIPLAARLLEKGCTVIDDRGGEYSTDNIRTKLTDRAVNEQLRSWGVFSNQQKKQKPSDVKAFADTFNSISEKMFMKASR